MWKAIQKYDNHHYCRLLIFTVAYVCFLFSLYSNINRMYCVCRCVVQGDFLIKSKIPSFLISLIQCATNPQIYCSYWDNVGKEHLTNLPPPSSWLQMSGNMASKLHCQPGNQKFKTLQLRYYQKTWWFNQCYINFSLNIKLNVLFTCNTFTSHHIYFLLTSST